MVMWKMCEVTENVPCLLAPLMSGGQINAEHNSKIKQEGKLCRIHSKEKIPIYNNLSVIIKA